MIRFKILLYDPVGGIARHTGRHNCFFNKLADGQWVVAAPVIKGPKKIANDRHIYS